MVKILGMRHGQKDGDKITVLGAKQVFAAGLNLSERGFRFERIIHSGAIRTKQSLYVMAAALKLFKLPLEENKSFSYTTVIKYHKDYAEFKAEMMKIKKAGGTLDVALELSNYARAIREFMTKSLLDLAEDMERRKQIYALAISHSPLIISASPEPWQTPYGLFECDGILYTIKKGQITDFDIIRAPIQGKTTW